MDTILKLCDPKLINAVSRIGVPIIILAVVGFWLHHAAAWSAAHIVTPLVNQQVQFMEEVAAASKKKQRDAPADGRSHRAAERLGELAGQDAGTRH
jgi:hypothetical protein